MANILTSRSLFRWAFRAAQGRPAPETPALPPPDPAGLPARSTVARLAEVDGLRGLAIILVLIRHYICCCMHTTPGTVWHTVASKLSLTWLGVDLFFILSGYLIGGILLDARSSPQYFKTFYVRRACRIFPLYYLLVLTFFLGAAVCQGGFLEPCRWIFQDTYSRAGEAPRSLYFFFLQNGWMAYTGTYGPFWTGITWTLCLEEQLYLTLPLLIRFISPRRLLPTLLVLMCISPVLRLLILYAKPSQLSPLSTGVLLPCRLDTLGLGVVIALLTRSPRAWKVISEWRLAIYGLLTILFAGVVVLAYKFDIYYGFRTWWWAPVFNYLWLGMTYAVLLLVVLGNRQGGIARVCRAQILIGMGTISYFVYLFHEPILGLCHGILLKAQPAITSWSGVGTSVLALSITLLLARLSWRYLERPLISLGHTFKY